MAIRAVFFDLDDTLLDVAGSHPERAKRIATLLATELPAFDANSFISRALSLNPATGWVTGVASLINELGLRDSEVAQISDVLCRSVRST